MTPASTLLRFFRENPQLESHFTLLLEDNVVGANDPTGLVSLARTRKLANARNKVVQYVENQRDTMFREYDYLVMADMDGVCGGSDSSLSFDPDIFKYALLDLKEQWDVITFRFEPYYDLWAFRHKEYQPENYFYGKSAKKLTSETFATKVFQNVSWPDGLVEVDSSFGMFAIYRMELLNGTAKYSGSEKGRPRNGDRSTQDTPDCEHVAFHRDLRERMNARHVLSPLIYCVGDPGYKPLPKTITSSWN
uniref:Uncharacterized protein n=1 Tax=Attheya septentrionalis TaxID=420275 RepID=A0A7S2XIF7_9STRA|mmetsp:Transcript_12016/g.21833  ORF Transcript_12016/g.21833 Transcript_12016/m.21833 type:complete len:249 (+) Transcript_12016:56-802(+)